MLFVLSPLMLAAAILVCARSRRPAFFMQTRTGFTECRFGFSLTSMDDGPVVKATNVSHVMARRFVAPASMSGRSPPIGIDVKPGLTSWTQVNGSAAEPHSIRCVHLDVRH
jgi:lipopolysaccharide/colanic/teichoic acid biosynthesis glycosyltransferase